MAQTAAAAAAAAPLPPGSRQPSLAASDVKWKKLLLRALRAAPRVKEKALLATVLAAARDLHGGGLQDLPDSELAAAVRAKLSSRRFQRSGKYVSLREHDGGAAEEEE
jgi:hypothetical protein